MHKMVESSSARGATPEFQVSYVYGVYLLYRGWVTRKKGEWWLQSTIDFRAACPDISADFTLTSIPAEPQELFVATGDYCYENGRLWIQ